MQSLLSDCAWPRFAAHALAEVAFLSALVHENLLSFLGACFELPNLCLITEFCAGGNLSATGEG